MMNRSRKALVAVAAITSLTLGSGIAVAQETNGSTQSLSSGSSENQNSSGSSNDATTENADGTKDNKSSSQELSTDSDGKELSLLGKLKVIGEVVALIGSLIGGAFAVYQTVMKFQDAMQK